MYRSETYMGQTLLRLKQLKIKTTGQHVASYLAADVPKLLKILNIKRCSYVISTIKTTMERSKYYISLLSYKGFF